MATGSSAGGESAAYGYGSIAATLTSTHAAVGAGASASATGVGAAGGGSGLTGIVTGYGFGSLAGSRKKESSSLDHNPDLDL